MADQKQNKMISPAQKEAIGKIADRLYGGTASTVIGLAGNFAFLNAVGAGDEKKATELLVEYIRKDQAERAKWKSEHPSTALPATV